MPVILAAVDDSPEHVEVLETTARMAAQFHAVVHVVSVAGMEGAWRAMLGEGFGEVNLHLEDTARQTLKRACVELAALGVECITHAALGPVSQEIAALARELGADLIVIGHRNMSWLDKLVEGSVGHSLLSYAPCSVLVVIKTAEWALREGFAFNPTAE